MKEARSKLEELSQSLALMRTELQKYQESVMEVSEEEEARCTEIDSIGSFTDCRDPCLKLETRHLINEAPISSHLVWPTNRGR